MTQEKTPQLELPARSLPRILPITLALAAACLLTLAFAARASADPVYDVHATWGDTVLPPGGEGEFVLTARNVGDSRGTEPLTLKDELPDGVTITEFQGTFASLFCKGVGTGMATCTIPAGGLPRAPGSLDGGPVGPQPTGFLPYFWIEVEISSNASGTGTNTLTATGGSAAQPATDVDPVSFGPNPSGFGFVPGSFEADLFEAEFPLGASERQAGAHPFELRVNFDVTHRFGIDLQKGTPYTIPNERVRTVETTLPPGVIGNPEATPKCDPFDFAAEGAGVTSTQCPANTQVGYLSAEFSTGTGNHAQQLIFTSPGLLNRISIYNLEPPKGVPADFGFLAGGFIIGHIYPSLDAANGYAIKATSPYISNFVGLRSAEVTFWGVPGDPAHDKFRAPPQVGPEEEVLGAHFEEAAIRPLLSMPMDCGIDNGGVKVRADSWNHPEKFTPTIEASSHLVANGCDDKRIRFNPEINMQPGNRDAGGPTGLDVNLKVPQRDDSVEEASELYDQNGDVQAIPTPPVKKAVVTMPEGMTISPSAAQGLATCSSAQIGIGNNDPVTCPDNSQYGTLILHTPLLPRDEPMRGFVYVAKQYDNPFHSFLSLYLVVQDPERGLLVKLPGKAELDPVTGQIKTTFDDLPQFPVEDFQLSLKGGVRAALVNPTTCGQKTIKAEFFSWHDPNTPKVVTDSYDVTQKPDGSPCVNNLGERPFKPSLQAGTLNNTAGAFSPFAFRLTRADDDQEFSQVGVTLPEGLAAKFAGVAMCPDAAIAAAEARTGAGEGALEQAHPSCPAASEIGSTQVGAGVGVPLTYVPGKVYLAGPYKGAPLSMVVISPLVVGPYDLGVIAVRTALRVDPVTAQGSAFSDPFPQVYQGIPVRIRDIQLKLDRPGFTLNPTSCAEKQIGAHITGTGGDLFSTADDSGAELANRFQAADCASLGFAPKLAFRLFGGTKRGAHPRLRATVTYPEGAYANIARASVALPHSEFLDQSHIKTVCTRVQFAASQCPAGSVYGYAVAKTPLFDEPLQGPVYLRSSSNKLPDMVALLRGPAAQPVQVELSGRIDSVNGGIRNTFDIVPDAPVQTFTLSLQGGKKGLLVNSTNLCKKTNRATAKFAGQNGKRITLRPALQNACKKARKRAAKHRRR